MSENNKFDFFISYNKADRNWAEWIAYALEALGYSIVVQEWDFLPGENFVLRMDDSIKQSRCMLAIISPDYLTSTFVQPEWAATFASDPQGQNNKLIPIRVRECELEGLLKQIIYIDLVGLDEEKALTQLEKGVSGGRGKSTIKPEFPTSAPVTSKQNFMYPGRVPAIRQLPYLRNINFVGRSDLFERINNNINTRVDNTPCITTFVGMGGVGKTSIALEYCYRYGYRYEAIWWLNAESYDLLLDEYKALGVALGIPLELLSSEPDIIKNVVQHLSDRSQTLIIFDNAEDLSSILEYLPKTGDIDILITSRNASWRTVSQIIEVSVLESEESTALFEQLAGIERDQHTTLLAKEVGYLPLAIAQACAYIVETGHSYESYLDLFQKVGVKAASSDDGYPIHIERAWNISIDKIENLLPPALIVLKIISDLSPDGIPKSYLKRCCTYLPAIEAEKFQDELFFDNCIRVLLRYGLIISSDENIYIHRVVKSIVRAKLGDLVSVNTIDVNLNTLANLISYSTTDMETWPLFITFLPQALSVLEYTDEVAEDNTGKIVSNISVYISNYYKDRGVYEPAMKYCELAYQFSKKYYGENSESIGVCLNNLSNTSRLLGNLKQARRYIEDAIRNDTALYGDIHHEIAIRYNNLGKIYADEKKWDEATISFQKALDIDTALFGEHHSNVAICLINIGNAFRHSGDIEKAKTAFNRALDIFEATYGALHRETGVAHGQLGRVLLDTGNVAEAREHITQSLNTFSKLFGNEHPYTQWAMIDLKKCER